MKSNLTDEWRKEISRCATDYDSGRYLISKRSLGHLALMHWISEFLMNGPETEVEEEVVEYFHACADPKLYQKYCEKYEVPEGRDEETV